MPTSRALGSVVLLVAVALAPAGRPATPPTDRSPVEAMQIVALPEGPTTPPIGGVRHALQLAALAESGRRAGRRPASPPSFEVAWARAGRSRATLAAAPVAALPVRIATLDGGAVAVTPAETQAPPLPAPEVLPSPAPLVPPIAPVPPVTVAPTPDPAPVEDPWLRQRADAAVALVAYPWGELGYEALFLPARAGMRARTLRTERRIEIFVRPGDSAARTAFDLAHEIAHAFDFTYGSSFIRGEWQRARGLAGMPWFGCDACDDLGTPAGDFAESFAAWQVSGGSFASRLGPAPDAVQRDLLERLTRV